MNFVPKIKYLVFFSLVGLIVCFDQWTKQLVIHRFTYGESIPVLGDLFSLTYVRNKGAAFGILSQTDSVLRTPFLIVVPILALFVIVYIFKRLGDRDVFGASVLALIVGGAIGNLIDRISYSFVVDFLDFHWGFYGPHFPAFNVADITICIGVFLLLIQTYLAEKKAKNASSPV